MPVGLGSNNAGLCAPYLEKLPVMGVSVSLFGGSMNATLLHASDPVAARLDELQFDLGEGPRWEALRTRRPVLLPDLRVADHHLWPIFGTAVTETTAAALYVFPLAVGTFDIGVVELYRTSPWTLSPSDQTTASALANQTSWTVLRQLLNDSAVADIESPSGHAYLSRREIHQATGMVLVQAMLSAADALLLLRAHAFANGRTLAETAQHVIDRELDFSLPGEGTD